MTVHGIEYPWTVVQKTLKDLGIARTTLVYRLMNYNAEALLAIDRHYDDYVKARKLAHRNAMQMSKQSEVAV